MAAIGIDLGCRNCCVAVWTERGAEILQNEGGNRTIPACVSFTDHGHVVGERALRRSLIDPKNTIFDVMQLVGRKRHEIGLLLPDLPYEVVEVKGRLKINVTRKKEVYSFFPEEILAMVLSELKRMAESHLQKEVTDAIIGIPGCFNLLQKRSVAIAAKVAGLTGCRLVTNTLLASVAYGVKNRLLRAKGKIMVVDVGSHSINASVISLQEGMFLLMSIFGNSNLGGESFTSSLVIHGIQQINLLDPSFSTNAKSMAALRSECTKAKHNLSACQSTYVSMEALKPDYGFTIARSTFESLTEHLIPSILYVVSKALENTGVAKHTIYDVVLVGGCTRVPKIQEALKSFFLGKDLNKSVNPDEAVAYGAAIQAAVLAGDQSLENVVLVEKLPYSLAVEIVDGMLMPLVPTNRTIPSVNSVQCEIYGHAQSSPVTIKLYEGENPGIDAKVLVGSLMVLNSNVKKLSITLTVNSSQELEMQVSDADHGMVLVTSDPIHEMQSQEEQEYMRFRHLQLQREEKEFGETLEARNDLEAFLISLREEVESCSLGLEQEMAEAVLKECRTLSKLMEGPTPLSGEELRHKRFQLQHVREVAILKSSKGTGATASKVCMDRSAL